MKGKWTHWGVSVCVTALVAGVAQTGDVYDFTTADYDFGSGTDGAYAAGTDFTVVRGYITQDSPADRLTVSPITSGSLVGEVGPGPNGADDTLTLVNTPALGAGTYKSTIGGGIINNASFVFGYTDINNYYSVSMAKSTIYGFGGCVNMTRVVGGVRTRLSPRTNGVSPSDTDIADVTVVWNPGAGTIDVTIYRTDSTRSSVVVDETWNITNETSFGSGQVGLQDTTTYSAAVYFTCLELPGAATGSTGTVVVIR